MLVSINQYFGSILEGERGRIAKANRRAKDKGAVGNLTLLEWLRICEHCKWKCFFCKKRKDLTIEHLEPVSNGGGTTKYNCVPCCLECNQENDRIYSRVSRAKIALTRII